MIKTFALVCLGAYMIVLWIYFTAYIRNLLAHLMPKASENALRAAEAVAHMLFLTALCGVMLLQKQVLG